MTPQVSVIVPSFRHARYLRQRLDSILSQTYKEFELIILDDCSGDGSDAIIREYASNPHVSNIVINELNSGSPFIQWGRGVALAKGKWIWIAESDDFAEDTFLETMIAAANKNPEAGLVYCDAGIVTNDFVESQTFARIKNQIFKTDRWSHDYVNRGLAEIEDYLLAESTINNASAVLFNAAVMKKMRPFDLPLRYIGDKYAYVKVMAMSDVVYVAKSLSYYRDPFNTKHMGKIIHYVHEQFKVFDWLYRNVKTIDKKKFFLAFYQNTSYSMYRNWNREKIGIFASLFSVNLWLFTKWVAWNLVRPFITRINKRYSRNPSNIPV